MVDKVAQQTEVLKVNVKTKRVNQGVVKEIGLVNYPGRPHRQRSPISLKSVMVSCAIKSSL